MRFTLNWIARAITIAAKAAKGTVLQMMLPPKRFIPRRTLSLADFHNFDSEVTDNFLLRNVFTREIYGLSFYI